MKEAPKKRFSIIDNETGEVVNSIDDMYINRSVLTKFYLQISKRNLEKAYNENPLSDDESLTRLISSTIHNCTSMIVYLEKITENFL